MVHKWAVTVNMGESSNAAFSSMRYRTLPEGIETVCMYTYGPYLVGALEHFSFHILGIIIPTDKLSYFSEG
jgi:hypothetical protein